MARQLACVSKEKKLAKKKAVNTFLKQYPIILAKQQVNNSQLDKPDKKICIIFTTKLNTTWSFLYVSFLTECTRIKDFKLRGKTAKK